MEPSKINNDFVDFSKKSTVENMDEYFLHCHGFYEIYYFIGGRVDYMVEGKHYAPAPDSILLFRPGVVHGVKINGDEVYTRYTFHFMPDIIPKEHRETLLAPFNEDIYCENAGLQSSFDYVLRSAGMTKKVREIALSSRFESLLTELYSMKKRAYEDEGGQDTAAGIIHYINEHISEDITLDDIAKNFFISKSQLNRVFRKSMNTTVGNYISLKRSNIARQLLHSGETAEAAAAASGFKDYSTFYRTYKRVMGHSPAQTLNYKIFSK